VPRRRALRGALWGLTLGSALILVGCSTTGTSAAPTSTAPVPVATMVSNPIAGATAVPLDQKIQVAVSNGTLKTVSLASPAGVVKGVVAPGATSWESALPLRPTTTYLMRADVVDSIGRVSTKKWQFTTAAPATAFRATLYPGDGATVGVGMPMTVTLNTPVPVAKQAAFESLLTVTTTPAVAGAWHWFSPTSLHWRPANYWAAGTKVSVAAHINGYDAGNGMWGVKDVTVNYTIGDSHVSTVDANAHTMTVTDNGAVVKTLAVSTGRDKYPTKSGVHVVSDKAQKTIMDSATVGIPRNSPDGYYETVFWDVRISNSGEFVHAAPWSVGDQGHVNVSHGCVNVSTADAEWFYNYSQIGDVVNVVGTDETLEPTNGYGDWQIPWASWAN
jgi:lipoprotein-anchoring transpeptidase ErfK/SrfK